MSHALSSENLFKKFWDYTVDADLTGEVFYTEDGMRKAADWQLEKCDDEIGNILYCLTLAGRISEEERVWIHALFKEAMRPTTQENN